MQLELYTMHLRDQIESIFEGLAFVRPLFYQYPGGLRFELSEGGDGIKQFMQAHSKAIKVCSDVFTSNSTLTVCLRMYVAPKRFFYRTLFDNLGYAGVTIPSDWCMWIDGETLVDEDDRDVDDEPLFINIAFEAPTTLLPNLLWLACASDLPIQPSVKSTIYLFNLEDGVMVLPYDDRGMDVVGPNHDVLSQLYFKHHQHLLGYDLMSMSATFADNAAHVRHT